MAVADRLTLPQTVGWGTDFAHKLLTPTPKFSDLPTYLLYSLVAVTSSEILKAKQKLGVTFDSDKLGGIDFTKFSKLTMCSA